MKGLVTSFAYWLRVFSLLRFDSFNKDCSSLISACFGFARLPLGSKSLIGSSSTDDIGECTSSGEVTVYSTGVLLAVALLDLELKLNVSSSDGYSSSLMTFSIADFSSGLRTSRFGSSTLSLLPPFTGVLRLLVTFA